MKHPLLALGLTLGLAASAFAQPLDRRPVSNVALLKARAKPSSAGAVVPAAAAVPEEVVPAFNGESAKIFATKVHPVLMNACVGCHGRSDHPGPYKLKRLDEGYENPQGVERNLLATVKQLDRADPGASPFLTKAVVAHGKSKEPPLFSKAHPAYKHLELWAYWAAMRDGSVMPAVLPQAAVTRPDPVPADPVQQATASSPTVEPAKLPVAATKRPDPFATNPKTSESDRPSPDDPFDPATFNRTAYPQRK